MSLPEVNMCQLQQITDGLTVGQPVESQVNVCQRPPELHKSAHTEEEEGWTQQTAAMHVCVCVSVCVYLEGTEVNRFLLKLTAVTP